MATATGSINSIQCNISEKDKDPNDSSTKHETTSKFSELPQNTFNNRGSMNGRQMGVLRQYHF